MTNDNRPCCAKCKTRMAYAFRGDGPGHIWLCGRCGHHLRRKVKARAEAEGDNATRYRVGGKLIPKP